MSFLAREQQYVHVLRHDDIRPQFYVMCLPGEFERLNEPLSRSIGIQ